VAFPSLVPPTSTESVRAIAQRTGYALNIAIGLQVLLGALTTGLPSAASPKHVAVMVSILGGLATLVASFLARSRGSNEPERSITRCKDLDQFLREAEAFQLDYGHVHTDEYDEKLNRLRKRLEEVLGNLDGPDPKPDSKEQKLPPV
jgi:hypothetical protein